MSSPEQMKASLRRFIEECVNGGDLSVIEDGYAEGWIDHDLGHPDYGTGPEAVRREVTAYRTGFPDIHQEIHELRAEGDIVAHRWTTTGTHLGEFMKIPPTKKRLTTEGMTFSHFGPDGKIVETFNYYDRLSFMQQLGAKGLFWAVVKRAWR
ncbi:MAG TPA: ester cyclase [Gaiellaceae bacterium]